MAGFIKYNDILIPYVLQRKQVKYINMRVKRDGIYVSASRRVSAAQVEAALYKHASALYKAYTDLNSREYDDTDITDRKKPCYPCDSTIEVFGEEYIIRCVNGRSNITMSDGVITVTLPDTSDTEKRQKIINNFLAKELDERVRQYLEVIKPVMEKHNIPYPHIDYRMMTSRWGSYIKAKNRMCLNIALCFKGEKFMKETIIHELTHYKVQRHDKAFYDCMGKMMNEAMSVDISMI